jgi:hypothetical protein
MINLDSNESVYFLRELEAVKARSYDVLKAPLNGAKLVPLGEIRDAAAETITYRQFDHVGKAEFIGDYANDLPRVSATGKEFISPVRSAGCSYGYSIQEIRAAAKANRPLQSMLASAAVRAHKELQNRVIFYGDETRGLKGLLSIDTIPFAGATADGAGGGGNSPLWANKTPAQIIRDMNKAVDDIRVRTNDTENGANVLVLPISRYTLVNTTNAGTGTDTTILQFFQMNQPNVVVESANEISEAERQQFLSPDPFVGEIMIAYNRSPDKLTYELPVPFEDFAPQLESMKYVVPTHSRLGGVLVYYPQSINIVTGI